MIDIILVFALLASAITANKFLLASFPPIFFVGLRMLCAGLILSGSIVLHNQRISRTLIYSTCLTLFFITLSTTYLPALLKSYALQELPSAKAAFFGILDPFITALYAYIFFNERLSFHHYIGIALGLSGALLLMFNDTQGLEGFGVISHAELAAIGAVSIGRIGWIFVQNLLRSHSYTPMQINALTMTGSGILSLSTSYLLESWSGIVLPLTSFQLGLFGYTVIMGNVIALTLYAWLLKHHSSTLISLAGFLVPLFVAFYGKIFLGERFDFTFFISFTLTFFGMLVFSWDKLKRFM